VIKDTREVTSVSFRSDGERIASSCADGTVKIWNSKTGQPIQSFKANEGWTHSVTFHPSGNYVATSGEDKLFRVWDISDGHAVEVFQGPCDAVHLVGTAYAVAFSPDGTQLAAGGGGILNIWDWRKRELLHSFSYGEQRAPTVAFSRDGRQLASGTWGGSIQIWDAEKGGKALLKFPEDHYPVTALAFSPDGGRLAQVGHGRRVNVWSTTTGALVHSMPHTGAIACVAYSPDGQRIASAGEDKTVRLWDATTGREVLGLRGHLEWCLCVTFSPDGRRLASVGTDKTIRIWDATPLRGDERQETFTFSQHGDEVWRVAVSPDGRQIASGGFRTPVKVWDAQTGQVAFQFTGHPFVSFALSWHPNGSAIASVGFDGAQFTAKVWDPKTGRDLFVIPDDKELFAVAFSPDGRHLLTGGMNRAIQVWDARDGRAIGTLGEHAREIRGITFSRDGRSLASASGDGMIKLWDATRLTERQEPRFILRARVPGQCLNIDFSPDGQRLASGGDSNTVKIWDVHTGRELQTLRGHTADVYAVAFSPDDGHWIASAGEDSTVKIWDGDTGELVRSFRGHEALVGSVAFSRPDGRRLFSASRDHTVKVWDLTQLAEPEARKAGGP
jgi:WD40 repeat protein